MMMTDYAQGCGSRFNAELFWRDQDATSMRWGNWILDVTAIQSDEIKFLSSKQLSLTMSCPVVVLNFNLNTPSFALRQKLPYRTNDACSLLNLLRVSMLTAYKVQPFL